MVGVDTRSWEGGEGDEEEETETECECETDPESNDEEGDNALTEVVLELSVVESATISGARNMGVPANLDKSESSISIGSRSSLSPCRPVRAAAAARR